MWYNGDMEDPFLLLSYVNTKLRDDYPSLAELCAEEALSEEEIVEKLAAVGYHYSAELNKFC